MATRCYRKMTGVPGGESLQSRQGTIMLPIRRCTLWALLLALTASFGFGAVYAQTGEKKEPVKDQTKEQKEGPKEPAKEQPKKEQKTYAFQFEKAPWNQVITWLVNITELPLLGGNQA